MNKLNILWTTDNKDTIKNMIHMYAVNSLKHGWWDEVNVIVWGGSAKVLKEEFELQKLVLDMLKENVNVEACQACAEQYSAVETFKRMGIDVKYMGYPLTQYLQNGEKVLTL